MENPLIARAEFNASLVNFHLHIFVVGKRFLKIFTVFFTPFDMFINSLLESKLDFCDGACLKSNDVIGICNIPLEQTSFFIEEKVANKPLVFYHRCYHAIMDYSCLYLRIWF